MKEITKMNNNTPRTNVKPNFKKSAIKLAKMGWRVFPCWPVTKKPACKGGFKSATTDLETIEQWWTKHPDNWIGYRTGNGILVVDVDEQEGIDNWAALQVIHNKAPETLTIQTPRGGFHYYYKVDETCKTTVSKLAKKIDTRSDGGYVIIPPSDGYVCVNRIKPQPAPEWIIKLTNEKKKSELIKETPNPRVVKFKNMDLTAYNRAALRGEVNNVMNADEFTRNDTLNRAAFSLGQLDIPEDLISKELAEAATAAGLDPDEIMKTIISGMAAGKNNPRDIATKYKTFYKFNPLGNAERFLDAYKDSVRYCKAIGGDASHWLIWDGCRFAPDNNFRINRLSMKIIKDQEKELALIEDKTVRKSLKTHLTKSSTPAGRDSILNLAKDMLPLPVSGDEFDVDLYKLNFLNGTYNLADNSFGPCDRNDLITKTTGFNYTPDAKAERWVRFVSEICSGNVEKIQFLQRILGMSLCGEMLEEKLFILSGDGANGKSTLLKHINNALGDYSGTCDPNLIMSKKFNSGGPSPKTAMLRGIRCLVTEEPSNRNLDEANVKAITGGLPITADAKYKDPITFTPQFTLFVACNSELEVQGVDKGIWRRLVYFRMEEDFEDVRDVTLNRDIEAEYEGILAWLIRGWIDYQKNGLGIPSEIKEDSVNYRDNQDELAEWISTCCIRDASEVCKLKDLYQSYCKWGMSNNSKSLLEKRELGKALNDRGFKYRKLGGEAARQGICVIG